MKIPALGILSGSVAADYAKRFLDQYGYDRLMALARRNGFVPESAAGKNATELLAYVAGGIADCNMNEHSFWTKFLKEVAGDMPSELAQRMHRGGSQLSLPVPPFQPLKRLDDAVNKLAEGLFPWLKKK